MTSTGAWGTLGITQSTVHSNGDFAIEHQQTEIVKIKKIEDIILLCGLISKRGEYKRASSIYIQIQGRDVSPEDSMMIMDNNDRRVIEYQINHLLDKEKLKVGRFSIPISKTKNPDAIFEIIEFASPMILIKYGVIASPQA